MKISKHTTYFGTPTDEEWSQGCTGLLDEVWVEINNDNTVTLWGFDADGYSMQDLLYLSEMFRTIYNRHCYPIQEHFWQDDLEEDF